jgi:hypothetical protein
MVWRAAWGFASPLRVEHEFGAPRPWAAMPCTDPREVRSLEEAFDITTASILQWELELIWRAVELGVIILSRHARQAAKDDSVPVPAIWRIVREGIARSKDVALCDVRQVGINFEGKKRGGGWVRVKVSWLLRYIVVTVHAL